MADAVARAAARGPVLVVVGRLHGLKRVRWSDGRSRPDLVERLAGRGIDVRSVMEVWAAGDCPERSAVWLGASGSEALAAVVDATWMVAMEAPGSAREVVDGVVRWGCRAAEVQEE